jgi:uncharacterized protein YoxC
VYSFLDGILITDTTDDPYNLDDTKVLTSRSITDPINQTKETTNKGKEIMRDIKEITQSIKDILQAIRNLKDRMDNDEKKIEEQE